MRVILLALLLLMTFSAQAQSDSEWEIIYADWETQEVIQLTDSGQTVIGTFPTELDLFDAKLSPNRKFIAARTRLPDEGRTTVVVANLQEGTCCLYLENLNTIDGNVFYSLQLRYGVGAFRQDGSQLAVSTLPSGAAIFDLENENLIALLDIDAEVAIVLGWQENTIYYETTCLCDAFLMGIAGQWNLLTDENLPQSTFYPDPNRVTQLPATGETIYAQITGQSDFDIGIFSDRLVYYRDGGLPGGGPGASDPNETIFYDPERYLLHSPEWVLNGNAVLFANSLLGSENEWLLLWRDGTLEPVEFAAEYEMLGGTQQGWLVRDGSEIKEYNYATGEWMSWAEIPANSTIFEVELPLLHPDQPNAFTPLIEEP